MSALCRERHDDLLISKQKLRQAEASLGGSIPKQALRCWDLPPGHLCFVACL
jgi:hypothetical protein